MARSQNSIPQWNQGTKKVGPMLPQSTQPVFEEDKVAMFSLLVVRILFRRSPVVSLIRDMGRTSEMSI